MEQVSEHSQERNRQGKGLIDASMLQLLCHINAILSLPKLSEQLVRTFRENVTEVERQEAIIYLKKENSRDQLDRREYLEQIIERIRQSGQWASDSFESRRLDSEANAKPSTTPEMPELMRLPIQQVDRHGGPSTSPFSHTPQHQSEKLHYQTETVPPLQVKKQTSDASPFNNSTRRRLVSPGNSA